MFRMRLMRHLLSFPVASTLISSVFAGVGLFGLLPAAALTNEEIVSKLEQVPVFLILNSEGQPLTAGATVEEEDVKIPVVFIDGATAESFLDNAQQEDANAQIAPIDLGTVYRETQADDNAPPTLFYFPAEEELRAAVEIQADFQGVPLFFARQGVEGPYLTITQDGESALPMFFSKEDLQTLLDRYSQQNPENTADIQVEVLSLEWLLHTMSLNEDPQLDAQLDQVQLFPSTDVLQYLRSQQPDSTP